MKPTTITLPGERALQLRTLAETAGVTISELIERMINREIKAGRLPDTLPGFEVIPAAQLVYFTAKDFTFPAMTPVQARQVADLLIEIISDERARGKAAKFNGGIVLKVMRKGRGIVLVGEDMQNERNVHVTLTPGMTNDLARIMRRASTKAYKQAYSASRV